MLIEDMIIIVVVYGAVNIVHPLGGRAEMENRPQGVGLRGGDSCLDAGHGLIDGGIFRPSGEAGE